MEIQSFDAGLPRDGRHLQAESVDTLAAKEITEPRDRSKKGEQAGKQKWIGRYGGAILLSSVMIVFSSLAHKDVQPGENWYFPAAIALSILAGLYFCLEISKQLKIFQMVWNVVFSIAAPFLAFILVEFYNAGFWHVGARYSYMTAEPPYRMIYLNLIFYYLFFLALAFLFGSLPWGCSIASGFLMLLAIVNFYVVKFRGSPLVPWDILSIRTAGNVASNFTYTIYWRVLFSSFGFVFLILSSGKMRGSTKNWGKKQFLRYAGFLGAVLGLVLMVSAIQNKDVKTFWGMDTTLFTPNVRYKKNGLVVAYLANLSLINIRKPEGYSSAKVEEIEAGILETESEYLQPLYGSDGDADDLNSGSSLIQIPMPGKTNGKSEDKGKDKDGKTDTEAGETTGTPGTFDIQKAPNIIVIMDEAFSDLSVIGDFNVTEDPIPFFRSMMDQYTSGYLMVSVKGGNTANTEYEFLAGDTMAFLPEGSVVFQQYISSEIPTLASYLSSLGYTTIGMHPYLGSGWDRKRVYPLMGFDRFMDIKSFPNATTIRKYVDDESAFRRIEEIFQEKGSDRQFIFEVTMQNHSGYTANAQTDNGFRHTIFLPDLGYQSTEVVAAERSLTLIRRSDEAMEHLISWFEENVTEPTIIVAFGDHEPSDYVTDIIDGLTGFDENGDLEETQKHYQVPYFIWNNFGLPKEEGGDLISVNYLAANILSQAGLPLTAYQEFLLRLEKELPVICSGTYVDQEGIYHNWGEVDEDAVYGDLINAYNSLTYNHLTDVRGRVDSLFLDPVGLVTEAVEKDGQAG